jgi:maleate cis-trans isomerase
MYAWRARIGLIKPTHRGKSFHFWYKRAPDGVEIVPTFIGFRRSDRQTFENAFERIEQIADDLRAVGCNIVSLSGTPPVLLKGLDFEREWRDRLSQKIGLPVVSQMEPHALALVATARAVRAAAVRRRCLEELFIAGLPLFWACGCRGHGVAGKRGMANGAVERFERPVK